MAAPTSPLFYTPQIGRSLFGKEATAGAAPLSADDILAQAEPAEPSKPTGPKCRICRKGRMQKTQEVALPNDLKLGEQTRVTTRCTVCGSHVRQTTTQFAAPNRRFRRHSY